MTDKFLTIERRGPVAVVWIDQLGEKVNTISPLALDAFDAALDVIEQDDRIRAAVFASGKSGSFIAGADLRVLRDAASPDEAEALSRHGHRLMGRMAQMAKPTVAALHGPALGGGLEMALACDYRIASDHPRTKLALPEVQLGLLPGGGGTQRLPRLIGIQQAFAMMLTGKNVYPRKARKIGLVDALIHRAGLVDAAVRAAEQLADGTLVPDRTAPRATQERIVEGTALSRRIVYQKAEEGVLQTTMGNYPAPLAIVACVRTGMEEGREAGLEREARTFGELAFTPEAKQLIFLFFAQREAEKNPFAEQARPVARVAVMGAGLMGTGIAEVTVDDGMDVLLKDQTLTLAAQGKRKIWEHAQTKVARHILSPFERDVRVDRVMPIGDYEALHDVDLIIEAAPEDAEIKRSIVAATEVVTPDRCVFASNTSSIPITALAAGAQRPEQIVGMHYFSPVPKVPLLEIVRTQHNPDWVVGTAYEVGLRQGKTVIVVNDGPGFYTTRILAAYMNEALALLDEGAEIAYVDQVMKQFGFPMGPFALFDLVGVDVAAKITGVLAGFFDRRGIVPSDAAARMVDEGYKGQKTGQGFYAYGAGKVGGRSRSGVNAPVYAFFGGPARRQPDAAHVRDRLALVMANEAIYCLEEGILSTPRDGDVGAVFGLGFPPFRGGPFRYVDAETAPAVYARLQRLAQSHGNAFKPSTMLEARATTGERFYPG